MPTITWPKHLENAKCTVKLNFDGLSENGGPREAVTFTGSCIFSAKRHKIVNTKGVEVITSGSVMLKGNLLDGVTGDISGGSVLINSHLYAVEAISQTFLPGGDIFNTRLELR